MSFGFGFALSIVAGKAVGKRQIVQRRIRVAQRRVDTPAALAAAASGSPLRAHSKLGREPGEVIEVAQHDGSLLRLRKLQEGYDPGDRLAATNHIALLGARGEIMTGLLYMDPATEDLHQRLNTVATPLNQLAEAQLCPGAAALAGINAELA